METNVVLSIAIPLSGIVIWALRLEGRINTHQAMHEKLADDVKYIRGRIDDAINGRHSHE